VNLVKDVEVRIAGTPKTPQSIIEKINRDVAKAMKDPTYAR